jgi:FkbH-like protein
MQSSPEVARVLRRHRWQVGEALLASIADWDKYSLTIPIDAEARREFVRLEMFSFVDYLATFIERGDTTYRDLYIGEKLKQCYDARDSSEVFLNRRKRVTDSDRAIFLAELRDVTSSVQLEQLAEALDEIHRIVTDPGKLRARVLLVGDCLLLDVLSFLVAPLLALGITLEPTFAASKDRPELERFLRGLESRVFDLVFFSPFSYAFHAEYSELLYARSALADESRLRALLESTQSDTLATLCLLGELFEAPILVHNSANVRRHDGTLRDRVKNLLTARSRRSARQAINTWLSARLEELNSRSGHYVLLDEASLLERNSEHQLGRVIHDSALQHPALFGRAVSELYQDTIIAQLLLAKKKVVACDLDHTLWSGIIGEGRVSHFHDRQKTLRSLRKKGMLLAVVSKNDRRNVQWTAADLSEDDFVSVQINWNSKVSNLRRIAHQLNLNLKDFVFIDDRADERAMVAETFPEILTLDAESPDVWQRLALLAKLLPEPDEFDRTLTYKQNEKRRQFLEDPGREAAETRQLYCQINLKMTIRSARLKDLKRLAELINRTNQFNMRGSRTSLKELTSWYKSPYHSIVVVEATDKFGSMGVVSVAVTRETPEKVEILVFVLSCRVFGYGIERALLNFIRRSAGHRDGSRGKPLLGHYKETTYNQPCRNLYPESGFVWEDDAWVYRSGPDPADPDWLSVEVGT